jgi:hypothetical protein
VHRVLATRPIEGMAGLDEAGAVIAILYDDEAAALATDARGTFVLNAEPATRWTVVRDRVPPKRWDRSLSEIRFRIVDAARPARSPGAGVVTIAPLPHEVLVVPAAAVRPSPEGPYVLAVRSGANEVAERKVEIGSVSSGLATVLSGLAQEDLVIVRDAFFFDAERRLRLDRDNGRGGLP